MSLARLIATCGGIGYLPKAPGTWGSLAALPVAWFAASAGGIPAVLAVAVLLFVAGLWASNEVLAETGARDPQHVVIDEVAGQLIALAFAPRTLAAYVVGFALFRFFDIAKPPPVRQAEQAPGAWGVMLDDAVAGVYAAAVLGAGMWLAGRFQS